MNEPGASVPPHTAPFRILTVCTGNICRSPMAERLLQVGLDRKFPGEFIVESAGTHALVGNPIDHRVAESIQILGGSAANFAARQLTPTILTSQDLVLTSTREHRSKVVEMAPEALRTTFTLIEFSRILPTVNFDPEIHNGALRWHAAVPKALRARTAYSGSYTDVDVIDPYRRDTAIYSEMTRQISPAIQQLLSC